LLIPFFHNVSASTIDILHKELFPSFPDSVHMLSSRLGYESVHHELLRESYTDSLFSRYTLRSQRVSTHFSNGSHAVSASWARSVYTIADAFYTPYTYTGIRPVAHDLQCAFHTTLKGVHVGPAIRYRYSTSADTLFVREFPKSEISAYNTYFFNLLEPTFGDTLPYRNQYHLYHATFPFDVGYGPDHRFYFSIAFTGSRNDLSESHVNTGRFEVLQGPRETLCRSHSLSWELFSAWRFHTHSMFWLAYRHDRASLAWRHILFPHEPDTVEIIDLAEGESTYRSLRFGYRMLSAPLDLKVQGSGGILQGYLSLSTPVLGYFLRFLPIAHQGTATGSMRYILFNAYADYPLQKGGFIITPRLDLIIARARTDLELDARLQFGLQDILIENYYIHDFYILTPGCKMLIPLWDEVSLSLDIEQILPIIKTVYPEPPPLPPDIRRYGGLTISAGVQMSW